MITPSEIVLAAHAEPGWTAGPPVPEFTWARQLVEWGIEASEPVVQPMPVDGCLLASAEGHLWAIGDDGITVMHRVAAGTPVPYEDLAGRLASAMRGVGAVWRTLKLAFGVTYRVPAQDYLANKYLNLATTCPGGRQPVVRELKWRYVGEEWPIGVSIAPRTFNALDGSENDIPGMVMELTTTRRATEADALIAYLDNVAAIWKPLGELAQGLVPVVNRPAED